MTRDDCKCFEITGKRDMHSEECVSKPKPATGTGVYSIFTEGRSVFVAESLTSVPRLYVTDEDAGRLWAQQLNAARETERDRCAGIADLYPALVGHEIADKIRLANRQQGEAKL